jgi:hypothetical protein
MAPRLLYAIRKCAANTSLSNANQYSKRRQQYFIDAFKELRAPGRDFPQNCILCDAAKKLRDNEFQRLSLALRSQLLGKARFAKPVQGGKSFGQPADNHYRFAALLGTFG